MKFRKFVSALTALVVLIASVPAFDITAYAANRPYRITVDISNQIVTIYSTETGEIVRQCLCSTGLKDATPTGTFYMAEAEREQEREKWFHFRAFGGYARYVSRIHWDIMFHSLLYNKPNVNSLDMQSVKDYGYPASHGCIRMRWQDAEFIAKKCLPGTQVKIYKSNSVDEDLRSLLFQSSFAIENGQTYRQFLGYPDEEGAMGRGDSGDNVYNLQLRLRDLGIYTDPVTGNYELSTVAAVRVAQSMLNIDVTGFATLDFQKAIYSNDAPFSMNNTLAEGTSGPAVRSLQQSLTTLGLYTDAADSVYDVDVMEAVKVFQGAYGYEVNGVADPTIQKAVYYEAGRLKSLFGTDTGINLEKVNEKLYMGRVNCELGIRMRKTPNKKADSYGVLKLDSTIVIVEQNNNWTKVMKGGKTGYVMSQYLDVYPQEISTLRYTMDGSDTVYTIGFSVADYMSGEDLPADVFDVYLASGGSLDSYSDIVEFATVVTNSDDVALNLRATADAQGDVLTTIGNGTQLKVLGREGDWAQVEFEGSTGYLMAQYLEFWKGQPDALEQIAAMAAEEAEELAIEEEFEEMEEAEGDTGFDVEQAEVACDNASKAEVRDEGYEDADVLGSLPNGTKVEVLLTKDGWCHIRYQGHEGYMRERDLKFGVGDYTT